MGPCNSKSKQSGNDTNSHHDKDMPIDIISGKDISKDMSKVKTSNFLMEFEKDIVFLVIYGIGSSEKKFEKASPNTRRRVRRRIRRNCGERDYKGEKAKKRRIEIFERLTVQKFSLFELDIQRIVRNLK